ncbi:MAG: glycosyltransferase [Proteobacteria bacterium]|nr:glycosyltransferase [Pseudomonadota bacterium]
MRVAYVIGGLPFGGVENWLFDLCSRLADDPDIEARVINVSGTGVKAQEFRQAGFSIVDCGHSTKALKTSNLATLRRTRAHLRRMQPDLVHTLQFSGDYFGRLARLGLGIPAITHIRNIKSERKLRRWVINKVLSLFTDLYLSVSKAAVATIEREQNLAGRPVRVLYNAVEPAKLAVEPYDLKQLLGAKGRVVVGVGRLVEQKNFDKLIRAMAFVVRAEPDTSLVILGDGPERERLERLVGELGLGGQVFLAGYVPNQEVPRYLRAAHILAMPSDYEGLPVTHVEALFCGLPAVISEHVPSIEIAPDCSLVCTTQPQSIAEKLLELLGDDARHAAMSENALQTAQDYTMERYVERLKTVYRELLG